MNLADTPETSTRTGSLTFLFTDIEGSTRLWQQDADTMSAALTAHDRTLRHAVAINGGMVFKHTGDGVCAAFGTARDAAAAALAAQVDLALPVRMGLHTGGAERRGSDYFGPALNRAARVMDAGHGGQILLSSVTADLLRDHALIDLGDHHLKGLDEPERIHQLGEGQFPLLRAVRIAAGNLPLDLSSFVGREREVAQALAAIDGRRLVTLLGVGGTGKTRLAVETARRVERTTPDGCWIVELGLINTGEAVAYAVASALGVPFGSERVLDEVVVRWRTRRALLVVDNCEHVLPAAAAAVHQLLIGCPSLTILATSREPLLVPGEHLLPVDTLTPAEAEALFVERARAESPDLVVDDIQVAAVRALCAHLDGLPLALELAASRSRAFTPVELVGHLNERFRLLVGGGGRHERHRTMRDALDWSYGLCTPEERSTFDRLSVIQAPFDLATAAAVAADVSSCELDVRDLTAQLVDRSLVQRLAGFDGTSRFRMLETMRAYGREHLRQQGVLDEVQARHAGHIASTISALSLRRMAPDEVWAQQREAELLADALVALDWFIDRRDWDSAARVASAGAGFADRETNAMVARLVDAIRSAGDQPAVLTELLVIDINRWSHDMIEALVARCWEEVRSAAAIPTDRAYCPPEDALASFVLSEAEAEELLARLDRYRDTPPVTRVPAESSVIRAFVLSGWGDRVDAALAELEQYVRSIGSATADVICAELHGILAHRRRRWREAAEWYGRVASSAGFQPGSMFGVVCAFHHLATRALAGDENLTGADLRDPWIHRQMLAITVVDHHGAVATAIALDHLGRPDLARRLIEWFAADAHETTKQLFADVLEAAGHHPLPTPTRAHRLDDLLTDVFAFADGLDRDRSQLR